ncbi:MAG: hypothetical protein D6754_09360 [Alphaproteobacteria bacterium]|nr:MAG: hypothetical protein D6754_09360 [Alphaproteobacteria bacterium]
MLTAAVLLAVVASAAVLLLPRIADARWWRATVTPLASIIGSGFLVLGPVLDASYGIWATAVMFGLCLGAYLFGAAIRDNIATIDRLGPERNLWQLRLDTAASWSLAFAYTISVAYYLNLLGSFSVSLTPLDDPVHARLVTTAVYAFVLAVGWFRGFGALERLEQITVSAKLAIIAGLLTGLVLFLLDRLPESGLDLSPPDVTGWSGVTLAFGLIVTVQGFETTRYLGDEYDARMRIRSMRMAQWIATAIYVIYVALLSLAFAPGEVALSETAIIDMMKVVAPILPILLVGAALAAQFSAAVADTGGSGGLIEELTRGRIGVRQSYAVLTAIGLTMTWGLNVFEIIAYASRAFALYYALQSAIAAHAAWQEPAQRWRAFAFAALAVLGLLVLLFGEAVEA